jgi:OOP family OmpA-OmpF porin
MHFNPLPTVATVARLAALLTMAAPSIAGDMYFLGALGTASYGSSTQTETDAELTRLGKTSIQSSLGSSSTGYKAMLGYQLYPRLAIEGGYVDMGKVDYNATFTGGSVGVDAKSSGMNFSVLGSAPINGQFSLFGKVGYTIGAIKSTGSSGGTSVSRTQDKNSLGLGFGGIYQITPALGIRAEWEKLFSDVNLMTIGLQTKF